MNNSLKTWSGATNGKLWGTSTKDWSNIQEKVCATVYHAVFDHLKINHTTTYLDVGCGSGYAAQIASQRGATVNGLDASEKLIEIARQRTPKGEFCIGDMESLPFKDGSFSCITGFNSFQYAANPKNALLEAKRVAAPNAKLVVMTWGEPEGMEAAQLVGALKPLLPPPPPGAPGPFALSDETQLKEFVTAAGLEPLEVFDVESPWIYPNFETAMRGLRSSGVAAKAIETSGLEAVNDAHEAALKPFLQADGQLKIRAVFRCLISAV